MQPEAGEPPEKSWSPTHPSGWEGHWVSQVCPRGLRLEENRR